MFLPSIKARLTSIKATRPLPARWFLGLCTAGAMLASLESSAQTNAQPQMDLPRMQLSAGMHLITAQVAATAQQREIGLMYRQEMPSGEGMLFVFESPSLLCFWMKNTRIPLTAAFIADDGTIINLEDMKPMTTDSHCAKRPARYVLEMNQGWFAKRGIHDGQKISGPLFGGR